MDKKAEYSRQNTVGQKKGRRGKKNLTHPHLSSPIQLPLPSRWRCEKIGSMVYHVIPAEAGIQDSQKDMDILDSGAWSGPDPPAKVLYDGQVQGSPE
jgi:hypothetical protein